MDCMPTEEGGTRTRRLVVDVALDCAVLDRRGETIVHDTLDTGDAGVPGVIDLVGGGIQLDFNNLPTLGEMT
jgi:hypothetical protein